MNKESVGLYALFQGFYRFKFTEQLTWVSMRFQTPLIFAVNAHFTPVVCNYVVEDHGVHMKSHQRSSRVKAFTDEGNQANESKKTTPAACSPDSFSGGNFIHSKNQEPSVHGNVDFRL